MADLNFAINKGSLENNINNVSYYIERLSELVTSLEREVQEVSDYYKTTSSKVFFEKITEFKSGMSLAITNFNLYKKDLQKLINISDEQDILLTKKIENGMADIKNVEAIQRRD